MSSGLYAVCVPGSNGVNGRKSVKLLKPSCKTVEEARKFMELAARPRAIYWFKFGELPKFIEGDDLFKEE